MLLRKQKIKKKYMETVLIVEVDRVYARATTNWLVKNGINARYVLSVDAAKDFLNNYDVDLVLSNICLNNGNGMELLDWMNIHGYRIPFLIMTGYGDIPGAVEAVKKGAVDYLPKPVQTERYLILSGKHWNVREGTAIQNKNSIQAKALWH